MNIYIYTYIYKYIYYIYIYIYIKRIKGNKKSRIRITSAIYKSIIDPPEK